MGDDNQLVVIRDFRTRAIPRDGLPNSNDPVGSVGPNVPAGFGDTHAMYPTGQLESSGIMPEVQAWQGWPTSWETPLWNGGLYTNKLVSTLWTCIDLNTRQLASFPIYGTKGVNVVQLPDWSTNPEPELYSDWTEFAKQAFNTFQSQGEIILWCTGRFAESSGGFPARFVVLNPQLVTVEWVEGEIAYFLAGKRLDRRDVCHIKYQSYPTNLRGIGPLQWAARSIVSASALERMETELATRGGIPWAILKSQRKLNTEEATELQQSWIRGAASRGGAPAVLSGTLELDVLTTSPREMMLLDQRVFDETRIAAALGVPPFLVGLPQPDGLTYSNSQSLLDFHWRTTLRVMANSVERAMSAWLLPRGRSFEFNVNEYNRPDPATQATIDATYFNLIDEHGNHAMTIDEIRMQKRWLDSADAEINDIVVGALP
jgi:HK97 family phage portal protein